MDVLEVGSWSGVCCTVTESAGQPHWAGPVVRRGVALWSVGVRVGHLLPASASKDLSDVSFECLNICGRMQALKEVDSDTGACGFHK